MARERAKTFAERLPPLVPPVEDDVSHLSDEMLDILYPGLRPRPFRVGVAFDAFDGPEYGRAVALARRSPVYTETGDGAELRHGAAFEVGGASILRDLFDLVGPRPGTEVLVDGRKVPYARELWLPLFWIFVNGGS
jgi:hypothetical protein